MPLIAIALAMLAAFPVFDGVRATLLDWVFDNFVPSVGDAVQKQVTGFIDNAGKLTAAGTGPQTGTAAGTDSAARSRTCTAATA